MLNSNMECLFCFPITDVHFNFLLVVLRRHWSMILLKSVSVSWLFYVWQFDYSWNTMLFGVFPSSMGLCIICHTGMMQCLAQQFILRTVTSIHTRIHTYIHTYITLHLIHGHIHNLDGWVSNRNICSPPQGVDLYYPCGMRQVNPYCVVGTHRFSEDLSLQQCHSLT